MKTYVRILKTETSRVMVSMYKSYVNPHPLIGIVSYSYILERNFSFSLSTPHSSLVRKNAAQVTALQNIHVTKTHTM